MYLPEWIAAGLAGLALCGLFAGFSRTRVLSIWLALIIALPPLAAFAAGILAFHVGPRVYPDPQTGGDSYGFVLAFIIVGAALIGALAGLVGAVLLARRITRKAPIF